MKVVKGLRSGMLEVIGAAPVYEGTKGYWLCRCDCGKEKLVYRGVLSSLRSNSCGCQIGAPKNLLGTRFGLLSAVAKSDRRFHGQIMWTCQCDCGKTTVVPAASLLTGRTRSCGCRRSISGKNAAAYKHGGATNFTLTPEYRTWRSIKKRCFDPNCPAYERYGAIGISVDPKWKSDYSAFLSHIGPRPSQSHSIDRIDGSLGYVPGNVRWATAAEQAQNRRTTRLNPDAVIQIRRRHANGERFKDIAVGLGVTSGACALAARGDTWANITGEVVDAAN